MPNAAATHRRPVRGADQDGFVLPETANYRRLGALLDPELENAKKASKAAAGRKTKEVGEVYEFDDSLVRCQVPDRVAETILRHQSNPERFHTSGLRKNCRQAAIPDRKSILPDIKEQLALRKRPCFSERITGDNVTISSRFRVSLIQTLQAFVGRDRSVLLMPPYFGGYERAMAAEDIPVVKVPLQSEDYVVYTPNMGGVIHALHRSENSVGAVLVGAPNNPTAEAFSGAELKLLQSETEKCNCLLIIDDTFAPFCEHPSLPALKSTNTIILGSMGEGFGLPRDEVESIGYAIANQEIIGRLEKMAAADQVPLHFQQDAALNALMCHESHLRSIVPQLRENQAYLRNHLYKLREQVPGLCCSEGTSLPFVFMHAPQITSPRTVALNLAKDWGVFVSPASAFGGSHGIRIGVGELLDIPKFHRGVAKLIEGMREILKLPRKHGSN